MSEPWYRSGTHCWGEDDIVDLIKEYDPAYMRIPGDSIVPCVFYVGWRNGIRVDIETFRTFVWKLGLPKNQELRFDCPVAAIEIAKQLGNECLQRSKETWNETDAETR